MNRDLYARMLADLQRERREIAPQLTALQRHYDALGEAASGLEKLLQSEDDGPAQANALMPAAQAPLPAVRLSTGKASLAILQSDPNRDWMVRDVWAELVRRGVVKDTKDARAAVRVALRRLDEREKWVTRTEVGMTHSYRWTGPANGHSLWEATNMQA